MDDFKIKLVDEQSELETKINKLNNFVESSKFKSITPVQQELLKIQQSAMSTYNECLKMRINW